MNNLYYIFTSFIVLYINRSLNNVLCVDPPRVVPKLVDLNLADVDKSNFSIIKSDLRPEAYKISPLEGKQITTVTINNEVLWYKHEKSECCYVTIYNTLIDEVVIAMNIFEDGNKHVINFVKSKSLLKDSGLIYSLSSLNRQFLLPAPSLVLDINCPFDKLYFNFGTRKLENLEMDIYEYGSSRLIESVVNKLDKIWEANDDEKFCKRVVVYYRNGNELMTKIINDKDYMKLYRSNESGWTEITEDDFNGVHDRLGLGALKEIPNIEEFTETEIIDLSIIKKNLGFIKQFGRLAYDQIFSIRPYTLEFNHNDDKKKILKFDDQILLELEKSLTEITLLKTRDGIIFMEITTRKDGFRGPNIYLKKGRFVKNWFRIKQSEFYENVKGNLVKYESPEVRYHYAAGIISGEKVEQLPDHITAKISSKDISIKPQTPPVVPPKAPTPTEVKPEENTVEPNNGEETPEGPSGEEETPTHEQIPTQENTGRSSTEDELPEEEENKPELQTQNPVIEGEQEPTTPKTRVETTEEPTNDVPDVRDSSKPQTENTGDENTPKVKKEGDLEIEDLGSDDIEDSHQSVPESATHPESQTHDSIPSTHPGVDKPEEDALLEDETVTSPKNGTESTTDTQHPVDNAVKKEIEVKLSLKREDDKEEEKENKKKSGFLTNKLNLLFLAILLIS